MMSLVSKDFIELDEYSRLSGMIKESKKEAGRIIHEGETVTYNLNFFKYAERVGQLSCTTKHPD